MSEARKVGTCSVLGALVCTAACGRIGFGDPGDPGIRALADAALDACMPGPWTPAVFQPFENVNTGDIEWTPAISRDGLRLMFGRQMSGGNGLLFSTQRTALSAAFDRPTLVPLTSTSGDLLDPSNPSLTDDELELYFDAALDGLRCIFVATRGAASANWSEAILLDALCGRNGGPATSSASAPYVSRDGLRLYYDGAPNGILEPRMTSRTSRDVVFEPGRKLAGLPRTAGYSALTDDELTIYFEYLEAQSPTVAIQRLGQATRASRDAAFERAGPAPGFEASTDDGDPALTADDKRMVYTSRTQGQSNDLFVAERTCL